MGYKIVFSDVDGTLLTGDHRVSERTIASIRQLQEKKIIFVIVSARSPSGIYPIQKTYGFTCPIICYSGSLFLDEKRNVLYSRGFSKKCAEKVISFLEEQKFECAWNLYSGDRWIVKDRQDIRVIQEEEIVHARAEEGTVDALADTSEIGKILCMCNPEKICSIEEAIKKVFPELSVAKSSDTLLEIMPGGVTKRSAVIEACKLWKIPIEETVAFGDHYNDVEMLETVALPFLMGNAPQELKERFHNITDGNDEDGIYHGLMRAGLLAD